MLRPSNAIGNFKSKGSLPSSGPMVVYSYKMSAEINSNSNDNNM